MRLFDSEAILLDVADLGEGDRVISFLTAAYGKKRGAARAARRKYSRFAGQLQPLARVRIAWAEKEGRELVRVSDVELLAPRRRLLADLEGILLGAYLAEHMVELAQEGEDSELYLRLLDSTLLALEAGVDRALAARYFEAWALRLAGVFPPPRECPRCGRPYDERGAVLPAAGDALVCAGCAAGEGGLRVAPEVLAWLLRIGRESLPVLASEAPDRGVLAAVEELCGRVRRAFLDHDLKSYRVMQEALSGLPRGAGEG